MKKNILLFTRYPVPGKCKTRLISALGEKGAAELQKKMTRTILHIADLFCTAHSCSMEIHFAGDSSKRMANLYGEKYSYIKQTAGDIGKKMHSALAPKLGENNSLVLIGSDCPHIDEDILEDAFRKLITSQVVLGPTFDGGYYLIGVRGKINRISFSSLFEDISWSTDKVFEQTVQVLKKSGFTYNTVRKLHDIDTPDELKYLDNNSNAQ